LQQERHEWEMSLHRGSRHVPLLADIAAHGLERALESGRADHERRSIVQAWIAVGTWEESANTATRSAHLRSGNSSPGATLPMSGSIWPSSSSSTTYRLMGSSRSLRILPARLMLPLRRRSPQSLAPTQTARPGDRQETNVPRSGRKRQMSWRYGQRPSGRRPRWSAPGTTRPSAAALMTLLADTLSAELPAASLRAEQPSVCFPPPPRAGRNSGPPCADLCPWFTGRDRVTVMASLARRGKDARGRG